MSSGADKEIINLTDFQQEQFSSQTQIIDLTQDTDDDDNNTIPTITVESQPQPHRSDCLCMMPFRFLELGDSVQGRILEFALVKERSLEPYFCQGMLEGPWVISEYVEQENIDISPLLVSKKFNEMGTKTFYSKNSFSFAKPQVLKWWSKKFESKLPLIRSIEFHMTAGFTTDKHTRSLFDSCKERQWNEALAFLRTRHQLEEMHIDFSRWRVLHDPRHIYFEDDEIVEMNKFRKRIADLLKLYRGLKKVEVFGGMYMKKGEATQLEMIMIQPRGTEPKPVDPLKNLPRLNIRH